MLILCEVYELRDVSRAQKSRCLPWYWSSSVCLIIIILSQSVVNVILSFTEELFLHLVLVDIVGWICTKPCQFQLIDCIPFHVYDIEVV